MYKPVLDEDIRLAIEKPGQLCEGIIVKMAQELRSYRIEASQGTLLEAQAQPDYSESLGRIAAALEGLAWQS